MTRNTSTQKKHFVHIVAATVVVKHVAYGGKHDEDTQASTCWTKARKAAPFVSSWLKRKTLETSKTSRGGYTDKRARRNTGAPGEQKKQTKGAGPSAVRDMHTALHKVLHAQLRIS